MTLTRNDTFLGINKNRSAYIYINRWSGLLFFSVSFSLHAARYAERGGDGRQDADGYLNHHFPSFFFHHLLVFRHGLHGLHGFSRSFGFLMRFIIGFIYMSAISPCNPCLIIP